MEQVLNPTNGVQSEQNASKPTTGGINFSNLAEADNASKTLANENVEIQSEGVELPDDVRAAISQKIASLKAEKKVKRVFVIVVQGDTEVGELPYYIGYFRRPNLMEFSQYMSFIQKDAVQANQMLATQIFLDGNRELVDDQDIFLYGTMQQLGHVIDTRNTELVKK